MKLHHLVASLLSLALSTLSSPLAIGQAYPSKPVRVVTGSAGSSIDFVARTLATGLGATTGQNFLVDNRPVVGPDFVSKQAPDGYTLLVIGTIELETLFRKMSYEIRKDFLPITLATMSPDVVVVHPSLPVNNIRELIAHGKANPGKLNYASGGVGTTPHLAGALFMSVAGMESVHVPFKGSAPAAAGLIAGDVQLAFSDVGSVLQHVRVGRLRALGVTSLKPSPLLPDMPTVAAALPGYEFTLNIGFFAPAKTPAPILGQLNQESVKVLRSSDVKVKLFSAGMEAAGTSPEELTAVIEAEMTKMMKLIRDAGIKAE